MAKWNEEQLDYAKKLFNEDKGYKQITKILNDEFDMHLSKRAVRDKLNSIGYRVSDKKWQSSGNGSKKLLRDNFTDSELKDLYEKSKTTTYSSLSNFILNTKNIEISEQSVRNLLKKYEKDNHLENFDRTKVESFTEKADGTTNVKIQSLFKDRKKFTQDELLELAGLDPKQFMLKSVKGSEWSVVSTKEGRRWNYSSSIQAEPKEIDSEVVIDYLVGKVRPYAAPERNTKPLDTTDYLAVPIFDSHFGSSTFGTYEEALKEQLDIISKKFYNKAVVILGGDILHVDTVKSQTTKGTQLDTTNVEDMIDDALRYFEPLIESLYQHTNKLSIVSVAGNHDYTLSYMFARILQKEYESYNIAWDIDMYEHYKAVTLGDNFIGVTHGDKGKKNYVSIYASQFPVEWSNTSNRELFTGHLHNEMDKDLGGIYQRQCSTLKPADQWTKDLGVVSRPSLTMVEYNEYKTRAVFYVG